MNWIRGLFLQLKYYGASRRIARIVADGSALERKATYWRHPHHYNQGEHDRYYAMAEAKFAELVPIGRKLYEEGGGDLMVLVARRAGALKGNLAAQYVSAYWRGVGDWR
jgi:hypothetical protein